MAEVHSIALESAVERGEVVAKAGMILDHHTNLRLVDSRVSTIPRERSQQRLPLLGIALAIPIYIAGSLRVLGRKSWMQAVLTGAIVGGATYALFELALGIALYPGIFVATH